MGVSHGGCPYADSQVCTQPSANQVPLFWVLLPISHLPCVSPVHGPCSLASGSGVRGLGKEASHPQGPKCLVEPRIMPSPSSFPNILFSRSLEQTLFLMVFVGVERRMCLFRFLLLYFKVRFLGPHSKLLGYFSHGADRVDSNYWHHADVFDRNWFISF